MLKFLLYLGLGFLLCGMIHEFRIEQGVKANYWRVLCYLKRCPIGSNVWAIAHVLSIDPEVVDATLERLHHEGYTDFQAVSGDHEYEWYHRITDDGRAIIEQYKWQLQPCGLYTS